MSEKDKEMIGVLNLKADKIIKGGTFFLGREKGKDIDFVAVRDNKILAVGREGEDEELIGQDTEIYEFDKSKLIMPGIHDNHVHLIQAGMLGKYPDLSNAKTEEEAVKLAQEYIKDNPGEKWVIGVGWSKYSLENLPTKESIDKVINDRPVIFLDDELHSAWVNSMALQEAGITEDTQDPPYGEIGRDENGAATGYLSETALSLVAAVAFNFNPEQVEDLVGRYVEKALSYGITSITDMTPYLGIDMSYSEAYIDMVNRGRLQIRVNAALDLFREIDDTLKLQARAEEAGKGMYRIPFVKQFVDGIPGTHTAMMLEDYSDIAGHRGGPLLDLNKMNEAIKVAHLNGMTIRLHACGDAAVRASLDGYENAIEAYGKMDCRHQIEHIEVINPDDIKRFVDMGIIASIQPEHIVSGMDSFSVNNYPQVLGKERTRYTWAFRTLKDAGILLAGGSDCPVVEGNPFVGMYCAMERLHPDGTPKGGWNPDEKLGIEELLEIYTYAAAYGEGLEGELGTLEPGKLADITVVDRNLLAVSSEDIRDAKVLMTFVEGKIAYDSSQSPSSIVGKEYNNE